ncbi:MAG: PP2C family protein-serine/threonine phosphatase [Euzebya sp.]
MPPSPPPMVYDKHRLAAVRATGLLDSEPEEAFDRLARLAGMVLHAPLAFVTIVDESRSYWKSCIGVDEEAAKMRQNPVEDSFCQYVIGSGQPVITGDAASDPLTRDNPSIEAMGVAAWAGVPLRARDGQVLGTFCVVDTLVREWSQTDIEVLEALAAAASGEIALRASLESASRFAHTLQRSLLPPVIPTIDGLEVTAAYRPAGDGFGVLGDFYDVFETQPNRWFIAIGDVRGHGPTAAETVMTARWSIRATANRTHHPAAILEALNRQLMYRTDDEPPHLTGALLTFTDDPLEYNHGQRCLRVGVSTAGHPPPVIRRADGTVEVLTPAGRPLGLFEDADLTTCMVEIAAGDAIMLVTDGITEARDSDGRMLEESGLITALEKLPTTASAAELTDHILTVSSEHQHGPLTDDVAVVVLRIPLEGD